jgi:hypothetical protein
MRNSFCKTGTADQLNTAGGNLVQPIQIKFPVAGKSLIDFPFTLPKPAQALYYPSFSGVQLPEVGFSFTPGNIDLNSAVAIAANGSGILINLEPNVSWKWEGLFQTLYFSVVGLGTGGRLTILALSGLEFQS